MNKSEVGWHSAQEPTSKSEAN